MSAEVQWSVVRKGASYTKKVNGVTFSTRSVDNFHRTNSSLFGRRRAVDVTPSGKLIKLQDGKKSVHRYSSKRSKKLLEGFRADVMNKATKKVRFTKLVRARSAASKNAQKMKKSKA